MSFGALNFDATRSRGGARKDKLRNKGNLLRRTAPTDWLGDPRRRCRVYSANGFFGNNWPVMERGWKGFILKKMGI
jgi:hypothetical protein